MKEIDQQSEKGSRSNRGKVTEIQRCTRRTGKHRSEGETDVRAKKSYFLKNKLEDRKILRLVIQLSISCTHLVFKASSEHLKLRIGPQQPVEKIKKTRKKEPLLHYCCFYRATLLLYDRLYVQ